MKKNLMLVPVYSRVNPGLLIHSFYVIRGAKEEIDERQDLTDRSENLQVAVIKPKGKRRYPAHIHKPLVRGIKGTAEVWVVLSGTVQVKVFDTDKSLKCKLDLDAGEISISHCSGHSYEILSLDAEIVEVKNGPYYGQEADKEMIIDPTL